MDRRKQIKIFRWRDPGSKYGNFGDEMSMPIIERLFGLTAIPSAMRAAELIAAGSILDNWARTGPKIRLANYLFVRGASELHVWGTGLMLPKAASWPQSLRFHAVRGPLTAEVQGVSVPTGDPGILASLLIERPPARSNAVGLVAHFIDFEHASKNLPLPPSWKLINPESPVDQVLHDIASCQLVISSSLHGLITADSFGIPCVWLRSDKPLYGASDFKFRDHERARAASFNEPIDYKQAIGMSADQIANIATQSSRNIGDWQKELIEAFPFR